MFDIEHFLTTTPTSNKTDPPNSTPDFINENIATPRSPDSIFYFTPLRATTETYSHTRTREREAKRTEHHTKALAKPRCVHQKLSPRENDARKHQRERDSAVTNNCLKTEDGRRARRDSNEDGTKTTRRRRREYNLSETHSAITNDLKKEDRTRRIAEERAAGERRASERDANRRGIMLARHDI